MEGRQGVIARAIKVGYSLDTAAALAGGFYEPPEVLSEKEDNLDDQCCIKSLRHYHEQNRRKARCLA